MTKLNQIIADLEMELSRSVEDLLELEDSIEGLRHAIAVLKGQVPANNNPPPTAVYVAVAKAAEPTGPQCGACGSPMDPVVRTLSNGKDVKLLACRDSGCNNEQLSN